MGITDRQDLETIKSRRPIQHDKDGLHRRGQVWHYKLKIAGRWREFSTRKTNYKEARNIYQKAIQDQNAGRLPNDLAKWPFERAAAEWLKGRENIVAEQTQRMERERMKPLLTHFAGRRLTDITSHDLNAYQIARAGKVSPRTVNLEAKVLRMVLKSAKLWGRISEDYKPLKEKSEGPGRALTDEQETRLFTVAASRPGWQVAFWAGLLAANTGMRRCEVRGLRLGEVDLAGRLISIRRISTKTDAGCRVVPLNDQALWAAARLVERAQVLGATDPTHYLLPAAPFRRTKDVVKHSGEGYDYTRPMKTWRTAWRALTKAAGLPGLRFHDLRHHLITRHLEAGTPEETLMAMVGHVSRKMLEHYSHIRMERKRQAVGKVQTGVRLALDFTDAAGSAPDARPN